MTQQHRDIQPPLLGYKYIWIHILKMWNNSIIIDLWLHSFPLLEFISISKFSTNIMTKEKYGAAEHLLNNKELSNSVILWPSGVVGY